MIYEFQANDGEIIEISRSMSKAPDVGTPVTRNGKVYKRVISRGVGSGIAYDFDSYPKISKSLPQFAEGADFVRDSGSNYGCPIIESRRQENDLCKRYQFTRDYDSRDLD